jgi:hypothetical protein
MKSILVYLVLLVYLVFLVRDLENRQNHMQTVCRTGDFETDQTDKTGQID